MTFTYVQPEKFDPKSLHPVAHSVLVDVMTGKSEVSVAIAFLAAKVLGASIYDVIAGRAVPAGTCRSCGKEPGEHWRCEG